MLKPHLFFAFAFASVALAGSASATVLTFDVNGSSNGVVGLPQGYGDNVVATTMGAYNYGAGGGFTPDVTVGYFGSLGETDPLTRWDFGYNDLVNVAEYEPDGQPTFGFTFDAANGQAVTLSSFDLGNFGGAIVVPGITITDGNGHVLWSVSNFALPDSGVPAHLTFSPNVTATSLRMTVDVSGLGGNSDNVGFDNIQFSQSLIPSSVPGPAAALPFGLLALRRRGTDHRAMGCRATGRRKRA